MFYVSLFIGFFIIDFSVFTGWSSIKKGKRGTKKPTKKSQKDDQGGTLNGKKGTIKSHNQSKALIWLYNAEKIGGSDI